MTGADCFAYRGGRGGFVDGAPIGEPYCSALDGLYCAAGCPFYKTKEQLEAEQIIYGSAYGYAGAGAGKRIAAVCLAAALHG